MQVKNEMAMENGDTGDYGAHSSYNSYVKWHPPLAMSNLWEA